MTNSVGLKDPAKYRLYPAKSTSFGAAAGAEKERGGAAGAAPKIARRV